MLEAPQMVINSRMLYFTWIPQDPAAVAALLPAGLTAAEDGQVFMNQYVVDDAERQTSGFPTYSLTYLGEPVDPFEVLSLGVEPVQR